MHQTSLRYIFKNLELTKEKEVRLSKTEKFLSNIVYFYVKYLNRLVKFVKKSFVGWSPIFVFCNPVETAFNYYHFYFANNFFITLYFSVEYLCGMRFMLEWCACWSSPWQSLSLPRPACTSFQGYYAHSQFLWSWFSFQVPSTTTSFKWLTQIHIL